MAAFARHRWAPLGITEAARQTPLVEFLAVFTKPWTEREGKPKGETLDRVTAPANGAATRNAIATTMGPVEIVPLLQQADCVVVVHQAQPAPELR